MTRRLFSFVWPSKFSSTRRCTITLYVSWFLGECVHSYSVPSHPMEREHDIHAHVIFGQIESYWTRHRPFRLSDPQDQGWATRASPSAFSSHLPSEAECPLRITYLSTYLYTVGLCTFELVI